MSTIPERIAAVQIDREGAGRVREFVQTVAFMMLGGSSGRGEDLAQQHRAPERVVSAIRAAVEPLSIGGTAGTALSPFKILSNAFISSLSNSAFDAMLPSMMQLPLRTRIVAATSTITGATLAELDVKRISQLVIAASDLEVSKTVAQIVLTKELVLAGAAGTTLFLENELKAALARVTDERFLSLITSGVTSMPSSGGTANGMRLDLRSLVQTINIGSASKLFLITTGDIAAQWATVGDTGGAPAFPNARVNGGDIGGVRIVVSDGATSGQIILADASGIAGNSEGMRFDSSGITSVNMSDTPDSPPTGATNMISLWQSNMVATKLERLFGAKTVRTNSVAVITGASYSGSSP